MKEAISNIKKLLMTTVLLNLRLFDETETMTTETQSLSPEMKTFYSDYLIDIATPLLVHDNWGQKRPIPKNHGKTIEFRRYSPLEKALTPLQEGVTPKGNSLNVSTVEAKVYQYGDWIRLSDMLLLTAIDNNMVEAIEILGDQAGRTLDTITREVLVGGTNVFYAPAGNDEVITRHAITKDCKMSVDLTFKAATALKAMNAKPAEGKHYICILHPNVAYDLMRDPEWVDAQKYVNPDKIYDGEIGTMGQVRYVTTSEAKIFKGKDFKGAATLTVSSNTDGTIVATGATLEANELVGKEVLINGYKYEISEQTVTGNNISIKLKTNASNSAAATAVKAGDKIYPAGGGAENISVYASLVLGKNAYGVTNIDGGELEHIVCQLGSAGAADPLKQRASAGWKATKAVCRLVEEYMVRIESSATQYNYDAN